MCSLSTVRAHTLKTCWTCTRISSIASACSSSLRCVSVCTVSASQSVGCTCDTDDACEQLPLEPACHEPFVPGASQAYTSLVKSWEGTRSTPRPGDKLATVGSGGACAGGALQCVFYRLLERVLYINLKGHLQVKEDLRTGSETNVARQARVR